VRAGEIAREIEHADAMQRRKSRLLREVGIQFPRTPTKVLRSPEAGSQATVQQ